MAKMLFTDNIFVKKCSPERAFSAESALTGPHFRSYIRSASN